MFKSAIPFLSIAILFFACNPAKTQSKSMKLSGASKEIKLMTLDPGHFHAALVQKNNYTQVDPTVHIYAPDGPELKAHLARIESYNKRTSEPTNWVSKVYTGTDYLSKMIAEKPGNVVSFQATTPKRPITSSLVLKRASMCWLINQWPSNLLISCACKNFFRWPKRKAYCYMTS